MPELAGLLNHSKISPIWKQYKEGTIKNYIKCEYCLRSYSTKGNFTKHIKRCRKKKQIETGLIKEELKKKETELLEIKQDINNIVESKLNDNIDTILENKLNNKLINLDNNSNVSVNINNNNNNNFIFNNYGYEDISYIPKNLLKRYALNIPDGIHKLAEKCHYCPEHPENNNLRITDKNDTFIQVRENQKWLYKDRDKILQDLVFNKYAILDGVLGEMENNGEIKGTKLQRIDKVRQLYADNDVFFNKINKQMEIVILNNSNIIK